MTKGITANTPEDAATRFARHEILRGYTLYKAFPYLDVNGSVIYWRIRFDHLTDDKWMRPMHQGQDGLYYLSEPPSFKQGKKPLYGLHLVAINPDATIWIVEGEKCVDALNGFFNSQGVSSQHIAITSGGASSANRADWKPIAGRTCRIWPDNHEDGYAYAQQVAKILSKEVL